MYYAYAVYMHGHKFMFLIGTGIGILYAYMHTAGAIIPMSYPLNINVIYNMISW